MTWTVYRWDDAEAPVLTGQAGTYTLVDVLDKCLVTGYGSKPGAGWTKPFVGTGKAAFRQGVGSNLRYLLVDCSSSGQYPRLRGYDTMSDVDTGTNPVPTDAQISGGGWALTSSTSDATQRPWVVFADEKRFYLWVGYEVATSVGFGGGAAPVFAYGDGVPSNPSDAYHTFMICGNAQSVSATRVFGVLNAPGATNNSSGHYLAGSAAQVPGSTPVGKTSQAAVLGAGTRLGTFGGSYPDPSTGGMLLSALVLNEGATRRCVLPGVYNPLHNLTSVTAQGDTLAGTTSGGLAGKNFLVLSPGDSSNAGRALFQTGGAVE